MHDDSDSSLDNVELLGSTLGIRALSSTKNVTDQQVLDTAQEIEMIQAKIDATEIALQKVKQTHEQRQKTAQQELDELVFELQQVRSTAESALRDQIAQQDSELQSLRKRFDEDLAKFQSGVSRNAHEDSVLKERRREVRALGEQSKLCDLESKIELERSKAEEDQNLQALSKAQKRMKMEADIIAAKKRLQRLEDEISDLTALRREKISDFKLKCNDFAQKMESRERDHAIMVTKLEKETKQREANFANHIQSAKGVLEREKAQAMTEADVFSTRYQSLQQLYQATSRRGNQQMQGLNNDIEKLKKSVEEAKDSEQAIEQKFREDAMKVQSLQTQILTLKRNYDGIQAEIVRVSQENERAKRELMRVEQASMRASNATTLGRRPVYRSVYYH